MAVQNPPRPIPTMKWTKQATATLRQTITAGSVPPARQIELARLVLLRMAGYTTPPGERVRLAKLVWAMDVAGWDTPRQCGSITMDTMAMLIRNRRTTPAATISAANFIFKVDSEITNAMIATLMAPRPAQTATINRS